MIMEETEVVDILQEVDSLEPEDKLVGQAHQLVQEVDTFHGKLKAEEQVIKVENQQKMNTWQKLLQEE